jgi:hypothetical protein
MPDKIAFGSVPKLELAAAHYYFTGAILIRRFPPCFTTHDGSGPSCILQTPSRSFVDYDLHYRTVGPTHKGSRIIIETLHMCVSSHQTLWPLYL